MIRKETKEHILCDRCRGEDAVRHYSFKGKVEGQCPWNTEQEMDLCDTCVMELYIDNIKKGNELKKLKHRIREQEEQYSELLGVVNAWITFTG